MSPRMIHSLTASDARTLALVALLFTTVVATGCTSRADAADEQAAPATPVRVRAAAAVERPAAVNASGTVDASTTADIGFQVGGKVERVVVEEGQTVRGGQLLASLDATEYRLAAEQAKASALQASGEYARMRQLYERHSLAPNDYAKFEAATQVADAQQSTALEHLAHTRLTSPISGIVVRRGIDPGETVGAGTPVFTIVAVDRVTIRVGIPEAQIGLVRPGAAAAVAVPALAGQPFQARVTMIGVSADAASRTYPVKLEVPNPRHLLLPGMIAEARIDGDRITRALTVPGEAVVRDAEGATLLFVYAPAERRVHTRRVTVGAPIDREIEITEGLEPGELVVVAGQDRVRDGAAVAATAEGAQSGPATAAPTTINRAEPAR
jgi:membrane fusion protein, multidrug efflux system